MTDGNGLYLRGTTWWIRYQGPRRAKDGSLVWAEIRESAGTTDRKKAERLRRSRLHDVENHRRGIAPFSSGPEHGRLTVGELLTSLDRHYETRRLKSLRQARVHLRPVREVFEFVRAASLSRDDIEHYIERRRGEGKAEATIDRELEILRRAFSLAREDGRIAFAPRFPKLVKLHANAKEGFIEPADFHRFLSALPSLLIRDVALLAYATGMRRGEILSLTWDAYDRQSSTLRLHPRNAKTGRGRVLSLEGWPEVAEAISRRMAERMPGCTLIFHSGGRPVGDFWKTWLTACNRAGVRPFTIHDLRRTAVRNMLRAGVSQHVAMTISGHKTHSMLERYDVIDERDLADAMRKRAEYEDGRKR